MRPKGQIFDLKRFRAERNLTQIEVATAADVPQSFVSSIENGRRSAPKSFLDKLGELYQVEDFSGYLSDTIPAPARIMKNIHNSLINSPGGVNLTHDIANKLSKSELVELVTRTSYTENAAPANFSGDANATLVNLLASAEERYLRERERADGLEEEVMRLKRELESYKK